MTKRFFSGIAGGLFWLAGTGLLSAQTAKPAANDDNPSAYTALRLVGKSLGHDALERVVEVSGRDGVPQPFVWKIVLKEGTGSREVDVAGGKIEAQRELTRSPASTATVALADLNLDSSGAFDAVDQQARKVKLRYDSLDYLLRVSPATGKPVWNVVLHNKEGSEVGSTRLAAHDGTTISTEGRLASNPLPATNGSTATIAATTGASTPRPVVVPRESPRPTYRPATPREATVSSTTTTVRKTTLPTRDATTSSTTTTVRRTVPPPAGTSAGTVTTTTTNTQENIPVATLSDRDDDEDSTTTRTTTTTGEEGGLFTRTGRTLDKTSHTVERGFRKAGASVQRFFTGRSDLDQDDRRE